MITDAEHAAMLCRLGYLSTSAGEKSWERETRAVLAEYNLLFNDTLTYENLMEMSLDDLNRNYPTQ